MILNEKMVIDLISESIDDIFSNEKDFIHYLAYNRTNDNEFWSANEEAIAFRFAYYLQNRMNGYEEFDGMHIDCNYNCDGMKPIHVNGYNKTGNIKPDVMIHKRNCNDENQVVIELKTHTSSSSAISRDRKKLRILTDQTEEYHFELGVLLIIGISFFTTKIELYKNGKRKQVVSLKKATRICVQKRRKVDD